MYKLAVTGPESTGKSDISAFLSAKFKGVLVPEFARIYLQEHGPSYTFEEVEKIAHMQFRMEEMAFQGNHSLVVLDTDMLVMHIWMLVVFGQCPEWITKRAMEKRYDYTLLMDIDIPWEDDVLREHPTRRHEIMQLYIQKLEESGRSFGLVSGLGADRRENAITLMEAGR